MTVYFKFTNILSKYICRDESSQLLPWHVSWQIMNKTSLLIKFLSHLLSDIKLSNLPNYSAKCDSVSTMKVLIHVLCDFQVAVTQSERSEPVQQCLSLRLSGSSRWHLACTHLLCNSMFSNSNNITLPKKDQRVSVASPGLWALWVTESPKRSCLWKAG